jgi:hypothetical protein
MAFFCLKSSVPGLTRAVNQVDCWRKLVKNFVFGYNEHIYVNPDKLKIESEKEISAGGVE